MKPNLFISYSRREVGFVDDLAGHLEKEGYNFWLDYRSLVPGKPWQDQIFQGIEKANIILLVVSKEAIYSKNVKNEWERVINKSGKRIILLIFEAVELPESLKKYEWVDFRGNYKAALKELYRQLNMPEQEEHSVPETGFKVPGIVWGAFGLSAVVAVLSLGALWTLFIPFFLVPLPWRIFKRSFPYLIVQAALLMLPFSLYLTSLFSVNDDYYFLMLDMSIVSIPFVIGLMIVLRSPAMQRWGKPEATVPLFSAHREVGYPDIKPTSFFIEHAPQDRLIATEMADALKQHGHNESETPASAESVFTLVSAYKSDSEVDCEKHIVYPVILQSNKAVEKTQLARVQWMDFRRGVRNLEKVGKLINEPEKLMRALGIRPMGSQTVLPDTIMYLVYFIAFLAVVCIGSWFPYVLQYLPEFLDYSDFDGSIMQLVLSLILFGGIAYFMSRGLVTRKGFFSSLTGLITGTVGLGVIIFWQGAIDGNILDILNLEVDNRGYSSLYPYYLFVYGGLLMLIFLIIKRKDLMRWFPARGKGK